MTTLTKSDLLLAATRFLDKSPANYLDKDVALRPDLAGMRIYDAPLMGVAAAGDPLWVQMQAIEAVGPRFMLPEAWLPGALSVISFFLPFTAAVVEANRKEPLEIPPEWLHGRIEGQQALNAMIAGVLQLLEGAGYAGLAPSVDERFSSGLKEIVQVQGQSQSPGQDTAGQSGAAQDSSGQDNTGQSGAAHPGYTSAWSERHVAYVCGLGTFGLSRCLITARGAAGRIGSIVTTMALEADVRPYDRYDQYCTYCGACAPRCPSHAIDLQKGKDMAACAAFQQACMKKYTPRYGCGKCSVGVPCTTGIPA